MKKLFLFVFLIGYLYSNTIKDTIQQNKKIGQDKKIKNNEVYTYAEIMPSFPGGDEGLYRYIATNIKYPESAKHAGIEGKVIVEFTIEKDGRVTDVKVLQGISAECDEESIRVVRSMPKWYPGKQKGVAVPVRITIPIQFKLKN